jgi:DNA-binding CsgD family transcriptional regulator/GAF domain-containing protein
MRMASTAPEVLLDFVTELAGSVSVEELQARYLAGVSRFVEGFAAGLYVLDPFRRPTDSFAASSYAAVGVSDFFLSRYEESGRTRDPVLAAAVARRCAVDNRSLMPAKRWVSLPVYEEVFQLHRMAGLLEAPLLSGDQLLGTLNFARHSDERPFSHRDRALADALARLIATVLCSVRERDALARESESIVAALELCDEAIVVTDLHTGRRRLNAAARQLLHRLCDREGVLDTLMSRTGLYARGQDGRAARAQIEVPLLDGNRALLRARSTTARQDRRIVVSFLELVGESDPLPAPLGDRLTPREREVAALAIAGLHDAEIAERLHLSTYTVKQYLRAAYEKCAVRSRVELTRRALGPSA